MQTFTGEAQLPLFLIGAGFNADAAGELASDKGRSIHEGQFRYPLVADTAQLCFGLSQAPTDGSIEELFSEAIARSDYAPLQELAVRLMETDFHLGYRLATSDTMNCYRKFFGKFDGANFLTFNYDSLPEIILHHAGRWCPQDGYGVPVEVETERLAQPAVNPASRSFSLILHLHGSFCLYTTEFAIERKPGETLAWLVPLSKPLYHFDPDLISGCFPKYRRIMSNTGYVHIEERVIAPVPDKSEGLKQAFVREIYNRALPLVRNCGFLIALGYSFNPFDRASYGPVLQALADSHERKLFIVSPDAVTSAKRVLGEYPQLRVKPIGKTFSDWTRESFPL